MTQRYPLFGARTSTPARASIGCTTWVMSLSGPSSSQVSLSSAATASITWIGMPSVLASVEHQARGKALIEAARQNHFGKFLLRCSTAARARIDHVEHDARIEAGFDAHDHRLRSCRHRSRGQHIVAELHGLAGSRPFADVEEFAD